MLRIDLARSGYPDDSREWLETDGRGGYASSTLENRHTRRYHGLLVANLKEPEGRHVLLSKLEDSLLAGGAEHFFSSHRYPGLLFPTERPPLDEFLFDLCPLFKSRGAGIAVRKSILMPREDELLLIRYDLEQCPPGALLRLKPFLAFRGFHKLAHENTFLRGRAETIENGFRIEPYAGMPPLVVRTSSASQFTPSPCWYQHFQYTEEQERGFDWEEDLFLPGIIEIPVEKECTVIVSINGEMMPHRATINPHTNFTKPANLSRLWKSEIIRREKERAADLEIAGRFKSEDRENVLALLRAARSFLITTPSGRPAVIAGYPWFGSWGRDTLISLPGLCFSAGRIAEGIEILTEIGRHERDGLLPNFFSADGNPEAYNTVDSSLWYFRAVQQLAQLGTRCGIVSGALIRDRFWPVMKRIIRSFMEGTRFDIKMDASGLLHAGDGKHALTWMDATVGEIPVTPRNGYPVEINALWYNALCLARDLADEFGEPLFFDQAIIPLLQNSFKVFWGHDAASSPQDTPGGLGDVFRDGLLDTAVRPNQIFAVSLPYSPLDFEQQAAVVRTVREQLLVPCGLRTLSPIDPRYIGRYRGGPAERDGAYHQGTVWPWLIGAYGEAALRVADDPEQEKETLRQYLRTFLRQHLAEAGIGSVSEVFDGDPPHHPGGCIAQAWSVAEPLRLYMLLEK